MVRIAESIEYYERILDNGLFLEPDWHPYSPQQIRDESQGIINALNSSLAGSKKLSHINPPSFRADIASAAFLTTVMNAGWQKMIEFD